MTCAASKVVSSVNLLAISIERDSSAAVSPYPDLISIVVVPEERASFNRRWALWARSESDAARVAPTVEAIPPAVYFSPRDRAENSSALSPAKIRWECESTNPGSKVFPEQSISLSTPDGLP